MERFVNARAEDDYYWTLRDRFEHGSSALTAPLSLALLIIAFLLWLSGRSSVEACDRADLGCAVLGQHDRDLMTKPGESRPRRFGG